MTQTFTKLALLITTFALTWSPGDTQADIYQHIDSLAIKIRNNARQITRETVHYRHTPEYAVMVADSKRLYRLAQHIHDVTHFEGNLVHLTNDLNQLGHAFRHLENLFDRVERNAALGIGHIHCNTAHVRRLLDCIDDDIHQMRRDVAKLRRLVARSQAYYSPRPPTRLPYNGAGIDTRGCGYGGRNRVAPNSPGRSQFGFSIGGRNGGALHFRF